MLPSNVVFTSDGASLGCEPTPCYPSLPVSELHASDRLIDSIVCCLLCLHRFWSLDPGSFAKALYENGAVQRRYIWTTRKLDQLMPKLADNFEPDLGESCGLFVKKIRSSSKLVKNSNLIVFLSTSPDPNIWLVFMTD